MKLNKKDTSEALRGLVLLIIVMLAIIIAIVIGDARTFFGSLKTIVESAAPYIPMALGVAVVISCGEIDLSVAGLLSFCGMLTLFLASLGWNMLYVHGLVLFLALLVGVFIGFLVSRWKVPSLILTLGISFFLFGISYIIDHILKIKNMRRILPDTSIWGIFGKWWWALIIILIMFLVFVRKFSLHWKYHIATGLDIRAAISAALPIRRVKFVAFVTSSLLCYVSAMLLMLSYNLGGWDVSTGKGKELTAIAAAVIGGTRISGGRLQHFNVVLAVILWFALLYLTDRIPIVEPEMQEAAIGLLVIVVAILGSRKSRTL